MTDHDLLLGIYLNDHLAGATLGLDLAKRLAKAEREWTGGPTLTAIAEEIEEDRASLIALMGEVGVPVRRYKAAAAWTAEKVARLKLNGRLLRRSPLSRVFELEMLRLGVTGKAAGWRSLRTRAEHDSRLDAARLDELRNRARRQSQQLERLRARAASEAFGAAESAALST
ncbi:MAG: hypothetical protein ACJ72N_18035 [Labedaea sp.]